MAEFENFQLMQGKTLLATLTWFKTDQPWFCCRFEPTTAFAIAKPLFDEQRENGGDEILFGKIDALGLVLRDVETGQEIADFLLTIEDDEAWFRY